jgi:hypothetical protein
MAVCMKDSLCDAEELAVSYQWSVIRKRKPLPHVDISQIQPFKDLLFHFYHAEDAALNESCLHRTKSGPHAAGENEVASISTPFLDTIWPLSLGRARTVSRSICDSRCRVRKTLQLSHGHLHPHHRTSTSRRQWFEQARPPHRLISSGHVSDRRCKRQQDPGIQGHLSVVPPGST